ncbi:MAG: AAA family ATPase [Candidatus Gottesmanbacteria bacterium]
MKITSIQAQDVGPIKRFEISNLGELVIIAGANGAGKTSLKNAIIQTFQSPGNPQVSFGLTATRDEKEEILLGSGTGIQVQKGSRSAELEQYMQTRVARGKYVGAPIHFDDSRVFKQFNIPALSFSQVDPDVEETDIRAYLPPFESRFESTMQKLYQKAAHRFSLIASKVVNENGTAHPKDFPDPLQPFIDLFSELIPDKKLKTIDPQNLRVLEYEDENGNVRSIHTLSSGEREVIGIGFDLLLTSPKHCVILIDEPELHLHPQLAFRLIQALISIGEKNQFLLFTHSGELITSFADQQVFYIDTHNKSQNQARDLSDIAKDPELSKILGQNIGTFAVGKNVIFVEGQNASLDKAIYQGIAKEIFPDSVVIPVSGQENIMALARVRDILGSTMWGISMFMIRDRDGLTDTQIQSMESSSSGRLKILGRRHLENYFLNENLLAEVLSEDLVDDTSQWRKPTFVLGQLREIAKEIMPEAVYKWVQENVRTEVGNVDLKVKNYQAQGKDKLAESIKTRASEELQRITALLDSGKVSSVIDTKYVEYDQALSANKDEVWKKEFPGKTFFRKLAGRVTGVSEEVIRRKCKKKLIESLSDSGSEIKEIAEIIKSFKEL